MFFLHSRSIVRLVDHLFGHIVLLLCGYLYIPLRRMTLRSDNSLTIAKKNSPDAQDHIHTGDIIICNSQSPIDILYLCSRYNFSQVAIVQLL